MFDFTKLRFNDLLKVVGKITNIFLINGGENGSESHGIESVKNIKKSRTTTPETNSSPLKMDGWKMILSFWGPAYFQVLLLLVSGKLNKHKVIQTSHLHRYSLANFNLKLAPHQRDDIRTSPYKSQSWGGYLDRFQHFKFNICVKIFFSIFQLP